MNSKSMLRKGIAMMLSSATAACVGQLIWKLAAQRESTLMVLIGLVFYGVGAMLMVFGLRCGELSILHPMMGAGYVLSLILGAVVLGEEVSLLQVAGVAIIIVGLVLLSTSEDKPAQ